MTLTEIKKELYKQKPTAELQFIRKGVAYYTTNLNLGSFKSDQVNFEVDINDMGDADLFPEMDAKLLIRYLVQYESE